MLQDFQEKLSKTVQGEFWTELSRRVGDKRVILASGSPQRRELIKHTGLFNVEIQESGFAENIGKEALTPWEYAIETANAKALKVYADHANDACGPYLVIAADTIVLAGTRIFEKPKNKADHRSMLQALRKLKNGHKVITAVSCIAPLSEPVSPGYCLQHSLCETDVYFDCNVSDQLIDDYVNFGEGVDAAGGYKSQLHGSILISQIKGDFTNVIGLPVRTTFDLINSVLDYAQDQNYEY